MSSKNKAKTKSEKREEIECKRKKKEKKGGTLAGQVSRTWVCRKYEGKTKIMKK